MRLTAYVSGVGLLLAGMVGVAPAQMPRSTSSAVPRSSGGTYYTPYTAHPPCPTPGIPHGTTVIPPGSAVPGAVMPGTVAPGTAAPGMAAPAPGATAPGAAALGAGAAAAAASDPAAGGGGERGSDALASAAPQMIGDLASSGYALVRRSGSSSSSSTGPRIPIGARSGFKIAENESPRPITRAFLTYNYFNGINTFGGGRGDLHRGLAGFEYAFLDGAASIGMRMPFTQGEGAGAIGLDGFGDLSILGKYAFYNDLDTGDVISGGLVVTTPTGYTTRFADGQSLSSVLLQPWLGFILGLDDAYVLGFTGVIIPTDDKDVTLYTLDLGLGYRVYNSNADTFITSIIPTIEGHLNTTLSGNGPEAPIYFPDSVFITGGIHFGILGRSRLTLAAAVPVTGPRLFDVEFVAQFNCAF